MPVPGYDPDDVKNAIETKLADADVRSRLSDDEWEAYQEGETSLVEALDEEEIDRLLEEVSE